MQKYKQPVILLLILILLSATTLVNAQSSINQNQSVPSLSAFKQIVANDWTLWANDPSATATTEITTLTLINDMANPAMAPTSAEAAALASIAYYYSLITPTKGTDRSTILVSQNDILTNTGSAIYQNKTGNGSFTTMYTTLQNLLVNSFPLYTKGQPLFSDIQQNKIGDCYFISAVGWLTLNSPGTIPNMISSVYHASAPTAIPYAYDVRLASGTQKVTLTQAEVAFFSKSSTVSDGLWEPVLQKAVAQAIANSSTSSNDDTIEPLWTLETTISTAGKIQSLLCGATSYETGHKRSEATWGKVLQLALSNNKIIQAMSNAKASDGIVGDHWHAILGYDNTTNKYIMWNPWGDTTTSAQNPRTDGKFELNLHELYIHFNCLVTPINPANAN